MKMTIWTAALATSLFAGAAIVGCDKETKETVSERTDKAADKTKEVWKDTKEAVQEGAADTKDALKDAAHNTKEAVKDAADATKRGLTKAGDKIGDGVDAAKEKLSPPSTQPVVP